MISWKLVGPLLLAGICCTNAAGPDFVAGTNLPTASAKSEGFDGQTLVDLAHWVRDQPALPVFSILISRHGNLVFELYTGGIEREDAHYMMSVTKSVLSALVGEAVKTGAIKSLDAPISQLLPPSLFLGDTQIARFGGLRLQDVMGMSALAVHDPPRDTSQSAMQHFNAFYSASNRVAFALRESLLPTVGQDFLYNDETPLLTAGVVQYATGKTLLDFGRTTLFDPLGFANEEWMHADHSGVNMGGYGFRMRPMDMQKFGILYLNRGVWNGQQVLPADWVDKAFAPYIKSAPTRTTDNYGWNWWTYNYGAGWHFLVADGWRGQRIAINKDHDLVVTMTGYIEQQNEADIFYQLCTQYVMAAITKGATGADLQASIDTALAAVRAGASRVKANPETRMVPSALPKETTVPFKP